MTIEAGVAILFALRRRGFSIRRSPDDNVQVSPFNRIKEADRKMISANKQEILTALSWEVADGAQGAERKARELLKGKNVPHALATENNGDWTYVSCLRRDGSGWTVRIRQDQFDPFRLTQALLRVDKELVTA
jgi:hypothetical protein